MKDYIKALKEIKNEEENFELTLSKKEVLDIVEEIERLQDMDKILRNENINLKLRINKAIIEIKKRSSKEVADLYISILKGDEKE